MSDSVTSARRVEVKVTINGHDATDYMDSSLLDLSYTDNASGKADDLQITLQDRDGNWSGDWMPKQGMSVTADITCRDWEKEGQTLRLPCGTFKIDEIEFSGPPRKVVIKALSAEASGGIRDTKKNRGWENTKLSRILGDIAEGNNLEADFDLGDGDSDIERIDQRNESDLCFASRISEERGMNCKVHNNRLVVRDSQAAEAEDPVLTIPFQGGQYSPKRYSFRLAKAGTGYTKAKARYVNSEKGDFMEALVKSRKAYEAEQAGETPTEKVLTVDRSADNPKEAERLAKGALRKANAKEDTSSLEIMGNPGLAAGVNVSLTGFGAFSGTYFIRTAEHRVSQSGYVTSLTLGKSQLQPDVVEQSKRTPVTTREEYASTSAVETSELLADLDKLACLYSAASAHVSAKSGNDLSDTDKVILCLPKIAGAVADSIAESDDAPDRQGWLYLKGMFEQWLSTSAALGQNADEIDISLDEDAREKDLQALYLGRNPFLISWDWAMSYSRFKAAYATFIAEYLLNDAAVALLMRRLKENEYFKAADKEKEKEFDFIAGWEQWRQYYHQTLGLTEQHRLTWSNGLIPDGFTACMGSYTLRALAAGKITCNGDGKYTVTVVRTAVVIEDTFNFGFSDDDAEQDYYFWSCQDLNFAYTNMSSSVYQNLYNSSFRQYRKNTGMGGDFQVLSSPHEVENFVEQSYAYQS